MKYSKAVFLAASSRKGRRADSRMQGPSWWLFSILFFLPAFAPFLAAFCAYSCLLPMCFVPIRACLCSFSCLPLLLAFLVWRCALSSLPLLLILPACAALFVFLSLHFLKRSFASYLHAFAPFLACLCAIAYLPLRISAPAFACILVFLPAFAPFRACHHCAFSCMRLRLYLPVFMRSNSEVLLR